MAAQKPKKANGGLQTAKRYDLSTQEKAVYGMISAKFELANEKEKSAREIRQTAQLLQEQWLTGILTQRSIDPKQQINVDVDNGVVLVQEAAS